MYAIVGYRRIMGSPVVLKHKSLHCRAAHVPGAPGAGSPWQPPGSGHHHLSKEIIIAWYPQIIRTTRYLIIMPGLGDFRKVWFPGPLCLGPLCHLLLLLDLVAGYQLDPAGVEKVRSLKSPTERLETCLPRTAGTVQWGNRCPVAIWQSHAGEHNHHGRAPVSKDNIASIART